MRGASLALPDQIGARSEVVGVVDDSDQLIVTVGFDGRGERVLRGERRVLGGQGREVGEEGGAARRSRAPGPDSERRSGDRELQRDNAVPVLAAPQLLSVERL